MSKVLPKFRGSLSCVKANFYFIIGVYRWISLDIYLFSTRNEYFKALPVVYTGDRLL